jgi:cobyrinic acid a,c-diamide synthase
VVDANGDPIAETGSHRAFTDGGRTTGSFFHLIAEAR